MRATRSYQAAHGGQHRHVWPSFQEKLPAILHATLWSIPVHPWRVNANMRRRERVSVLGRALGAAAAAQPHGPLLRGGLELAACAAQRTARTAALPSGCDSQRVSGAFKSWPRLRVLLRIASGRRGICRVAPSAASAASTRAWWHQQPVRTNADRARKGTKQLCRSYPQRQALLCTHGPSQRAPTQPEQPAAGCGAWCSRSEEKGHGSNRVRMCCGHLQHQNLRHALPCALIA